MGTPTRNCKRSELEHVRKFVAYAKSRVNAARYYPPLNSHRYTVALALYSKCLTVAEAAMLLIGAGFSDEAFGMTRTLVDIFLTLHYIANQDTEDRARRYYYFVAKDIDVWSDLVKDYWPHMSQPMSPRAKTIASRYPSPHSWSGKTTKEMALEPDTVETDPKTGKPTVHDFAYRAIYRWTSHFVHPTIVALKNHIVRPGKDNFTVRIGGAENLTHSATFNTATYVCMTMVTFYRCMGDSQPERVGTWSGALMKHLARRHK
jgi:Family of unknown function (DUF5677)